MTAYLAGLILGFTMILPIGVQNLFVLNQGLRAGFPRVLVATTATSLCDTALIVLGAAGASALLTAAPGLREALIAGGVVFIVVLGLRTMVARPEMSSAPRIVAPGAVALQAVGVSLLNPHAVLDTVGVIGGAIAARAMEARAPFALGAISASWLWFLALGLGGALFQAWLTPAVRLWIQRGSGLLMLVFACILATELW
jgi:L-lysine exporter family protein LysE/ArgO